MICQDFAYRWRPGCSNGLTSSFEKVDDFSAALIGATPSLFLARFVGIKHHDLIDRR
jgi:hypothetical protein